MNNYQRDIVHSLNALDQQLSKSIKNWYKEFPLIATEVLSELNSAPFRDPELLTKVFTLKNWPAQQFNSGHFADLSFTLYRNNHFLLDLYIWHHQDTNIHDHHFSGAFKIVQGESYHISYDYQKSESFYPWLSKGKLLVKDKSQLKENNVKMIKFSNQFIHQNMHTSNPCVTLCLRTVDHPKIQLCSYYNLGMKIKLYNMTLSETKMLEGIMYLCSLGENEKAINLLLSKLKDHALYSTLTGQYPFFQRANPKFHSLIHAELSRRNKDLHKWFKKVIDNQAQLTHQLCSMFKGQP